MTLFLEGVKAGLLCAAFFDFFRALRKTKKHPEWAVSAEDFIFWLFVSEKLIQLIQIKNHGVLRLYIFLGWGLGVLLYYLTIGKLLFPVFAGFLRLLKYILSKCYAIFEIIKKIIKFLIILPLKKIWERIKILGNNI